MKTAYPKSILDKYLILDLWKKWKDHPSLQTPEIQTSILQVQNQLFMPPWWIRVGLFFATWIGAGVGLGFFAALFFESLFSYQVAAIVQSVVLGLICLVVNLHFIKSKFHFRSGLDDALIIMTLGFGFFAFYMLREALRLPEFQWYSLVVASFLTMLYARFFIDRLVSLVALILFLWGTYAFLGQFGIRMMFFFPFLEGIIGLTVTIMAIRERKKGNIYMEEWVDWWLLMGLILTVFSLQYAPYQAMFSMIMPFGGKAPFALVFQLAGIIVPGLVLAWGIKNKERAALWVGFLGVCFGLFTFLWQVLLLPVYVGLCIMGLIGFLMGYWLFVRLKADSISGFNLDPNANRHFLQDMLTRQILVATSIQKPEVPDQPEMGEGKFGGAGSSDSF